MGVNYNPAIVTNGLLVYLDAANPKSVSNVNRNILISPEDLGNIAWGKGNVTTPVNVTTSPSGTLTSDAIVESTAASAFHYINQVISKPAVSATFTFSCYIKNLSSNRLVALRISDASASNGVITVFSPILGTITTTATVFGTGFTLPFSTITADANGWYRVTLTATTNATTSITAQIEINTLVTNVYTGDGISGAYIWGTQLEYGSFATAYYSISSTAQSITWTDLSGNSNDGTMFNGITFNNSNGGSLSFDGVDDYVQLPTAVLAGLSEATVCAFLYPMSIDGGAIFSEGGIPSSTARWQYNLTTSIWWTRDASTTPEGPRNNDLGVNYLTVNAWNFVTAVYSVAGGFKSFYVNAVQQASTTTSVDQLTSVRVPFNTFLGRPTDPGDVTDNYFNGRMAAVQVYNRSLTQTEIQQNFNALRGRYGI